MGTLTSLNPPGHSRPVMELLLQPTICNVSQFISVIRSTCFRRVFRPSSWAQNCTYSVRHLSDQYCYLLLAWLGWNWFTCKSVSEFMVTVYCECQPFSEMYALCGNWLYCCIGGKPCSHLKLSRSVTGNRINRDKTAIFSDKKLFTSFAADFPWLSWPSRARLVSRPSDYNNLPTDSSLCTNTNPTSALKTETLCACASGIIH